MKSAQAMADKERFINDNLIQARSVNSNLLAMKAAYAYHTIYTIIILCTMIINLYNLIITTGWTAVMKSCNPNQTHHLAQNEN